MILDSGLLFWATLYMALWLHCKVRKRGLGLRPRLYVPRAAYCSCMSAERLRHILHTAQAPAHELWPAFIQLYVAIGLPFNGLRPLLITSHLPALGGRKAALA